VNGDDVREMRVGDGVAVGSQQSQGHGTVSAKDVYIRGDSVLKRLNDLKSRVEALEDKVGTQ